MRKEDVQDIIARIPRLYAAASLKHHQRADGHDAGAEGIPRLYAAASLKLRPRTGSHLDRRDVFRGFMPRPH